MAGDIADPRIIEMQAQVCRALADPKRLRILYALFEGERSVGELAEEVGASMANVSQHLNLLRGRGLVRTRREGASILYSLAFPEIRDACQALRAVLSRQVAEGSELSGLLELAGLHGRNGTQKAGK